MAYYFYNTDADCLLEQPLPRYPVLIEKQIAAVGGDRQKYGEQLGQLKRDDILLMYENGTGIVALGRVEDDKWDGETHTAPMYYAPSEMQRFKGGPPHEYRIAVDWFLDLSRPPHSPVKIDELRAKLGYKAPWAPRGSVVLVGRESVAAQIVAGLQFSGARLPEEIAEPSLFVEGAAVSVSINAFERSPEARRRCIEHHGAACCVCGFDFGAIYGPDAEGYIHVHHIRPLSEIGREYLVDPVEDLRPVCPNCHAVIHLGERCRTVEEVRELLPR